MFLTNLAAEFPQDPAVIYLNHAGVAPWPQRTCKTITAFAQENTTQGAKSYPHWLFVENQLKKQLQLLINAPQVEDIALLKNTSEALSVIAYGLSWQAGDNIVITDQEFPSNRIVWESLKSQGVEIREANLANNSPEQAIFNACDKNTKLMAVSSVQFSTGFKLDLEKIGQFCQAEAILFCVDAIQSLGAMPFNVQQIQADFVAADGHKWMLAPEGVALFYCRAELRPQLKLYQYGWHMIEEAGNYDKRAWEPAHSARRFECGSPNMLGIHGLQASLALLLEIGIPNVQELLFENISFLIHLLRQRTDIEILSDLSAKRRSGIITFRSREKASQLLYNYLMDHGVVCALRSGSIRFSPHFYTSKEQLEKAVQSII